MPRPISLRHISAALLLAAGSVADAQELIVNGEFDTDLSNWTVPRPLDATWIALDRASAMSGSAFLFNDAAEANTEIVLLRQCVAPTIAGAYELTAQGFIPPNQEPGRLEVLYRRFPQPQCQGAQVNGGFFLDTIGRWSAGSSTLADLTLQPADIGQVSFEVVVSLVKFPAGGSINAAVDSVSLERTVLFADGFE